MHPNGRAKPVSLPPALENTAIADYICFVFATELLATDVLGVVMARTMWARREKSSAGFHFVAPPFAEPRFAAARLS
jgi:hypothetical protein